MLEDLGHTRVTDLSTNIFKTFGKASSCKPLSILVKKQSKTFYWKRFVHSVQEMEEAFYTYSKSDSVLSY